VHLAEFRRRISTPLTWFGRTTFPFDLFSGSSLGGVFRAFIVGQLP
jgi:hypothetical protein